MTATIAKTGREQRKKTAAARSRLPALDSFYRYVLPPITPGEFQFELTLLRPKLPDFALSNFCESFSWEESSSEMTGSMLLRRSDAGNAATLPIERGHRVRCRVKWMGGWYVLWTMRCNPPEVQAEQGLVSVELKDDLDLIKRTKRDWSFRATKRRHFGYFPQEIVRTVCKRSGIKMGAIAKGRYRVPAFSLKNASPLDVFKRAYAHEKQKTGRSFVIRLRDGKLEIVPLRRNPILYILSKQIQTALITQEAAAKTPATVLTGRARIGTGKSARKISYTAYDRKVVERFGYVHDTHNYGRVNSRGDLKGRVQHDLANKLKVNRTATVTHEGIPFIRRGDGIKLDLREEGFAGAQAFVYATTAQHAVSGSDYVSTWTFTADDPFVKVKAEEEKAQRAQKRSERKRSQTKVAGKA